MFYIEEKTTDLKTRLECGNKVRINGIDMTMTGYDPETKTISFSFVLRDMAIVAHYKHIMGSRWINSIYTVELGIVVENDWVYQLPTKPRIKEIAIGKNFMIHDINSRERMTLRFIGFVTGANVFDGILQYSSFASNGLCDAMLFLSPDGRVFMFDYAGRWYKHINGVMSETNIKCTTTLKFE